MPSTVVRRLLTATVAVAALAMSVTTLVGAQPAPAAGDREKQIGQYSGFEGSEETLGRAVAAAIKSASPDGSPRHDFTGREALLGRTVGTVIKTLNHDRVYQHETNDALVKMTLDYIQFAKRHGMLRQMVDEDIRSQRQQLERVAKLIQRTGNRDLALVGVFEQTACFFEPGRVTYRSPYGVVLNETRRMGIHDLTEQEIHEMWTIPRMALYSQILGVEMKVSPWHEDGVITVTVEL
jgi:hypothetical protein